MTLTLKNDPIRLLIRLANAYTESLKAHYQMLIMAKFVQNQSRSRGLAKNSIISKVRNRLIFEISFLFYL